MKKAFQFLFVLACLACLSFVGKKKTANQVIVYGIVYTTVCNSDSYYSHTYKLVDASRVWEAKREMEQYLADEYPGKKFRVSSSDYDCGPECNNMCIYSYYKKSYSGCSYSVVGFAFSRSQEAAYDKALKNTSLWSDGSGKMRVVEQKYW